MRRSLVAAGFAVVGASNAEIAARLAARLVARASVTFDEALAATDGVAERVSVTLGESLLQMVVDTTTPPPSPKEEILGGELMVVGAWLEVNMRLVGG